MYDSYFIHERIDTSIESDKNIQTDAAEKCIDGCVDGRMLSNVISMNTKMASLEVRKAMIIQELGGIYKLKSTNRIGNLISEQGQLLPVLVDLNLYIKESFPVVEELTLSLLDESNQWQTLFVELPEMDDVELLMNIIDDVQDYIIDNFPNQSKFLNISF